MKILAVLLATALASAVAPAQVFVEARRVYPVSSQPIDDGIIVVTDGKIAAVGKKGEVTIPEGHRGMVADVVIPGLIDARTVVGLAGWLNQDQDQDQLDRSAAMQPELRAIDAYDARDPLVEWVRGFGVTTLHTGHAPGALISGQTMIVKTGPGDTVDANVVEPFAMVACSLGDSATGTDDKPPGNRSKAVAMLRQKMIDAWRYAQARDSKDETQRPARDLALEAMTAVMRGDVPLLVHAHRDRDLLAALRLREEFGIRVVLDGAAESYRISGELREASVDVIAHAPMIRARGDAENATLQLGQRLAAANIRFAYQSGYESYVPKTRVVLFEAGIGGAHGLGFDGALRAVTLDAARILDIDDRVGSLEVGKDGDLALFDGDPFEYTTHCIGVVIDGVLVSERAR